jgi:hypothetical protein
VNHAEQTQFDAAAVAYAREVDLATETARPSHLYRPTLSRDGNKWCALYGGNLHDGVAGFGDSPAEAYADFDKAWTQKLVAP